MVCIKRGVDTDMSVLELELAPHLGPLRRRIEECLRARRASGEGKQVLTLEVGDAVNPERLDELFRVQRLH